MRHSGPGRHRRRLTAMLARSDQKKKSPTAMGIAAGLEHFILADGFGNHVYASRGRAASASSFDALLSNRLSALDAGEGASC